ncbi:MAG: hypothetical protein ACYTBZ_05080 [Planctomycetota bacterium]
MNIRHSISNIRLVLLLVLVFWGLLLVEANGQPNFVFYLVDVPPDC